MENKSQWSSNLGFILVTAGAAVGLGNLWKFPYLMGKNGGFQFLIVYLIFILILGIPVMITETGIGRMTQSGPVKAYEKLSSKAKWIGVVGVACAFIILSYYSVIGGWVIKYIISYASTQSAPADFAAYIAQPFEPIVWHVVFMIATIVICYKGAKGIEKAAKFMMPALLVMLLIVVVRSVTLPNASEGLAFIFTPKSGFSFSSIPAALGQVFYSLSLCMGITVAYGSYLKKEENIIKNVSIAAGLDSAVALLAGIAIFPAVFSFNLEPSQGPGLTFDTLPKVFDSMQAGWIFAIAFFILMLFAALTSSIALLECVTLSIINKFNWSRKKAVIIVGTGITLLGILPALSFGVLGDVTILNYSVFDFMGMITDNILMPIGGIMMCVFVGWIWGPKHLVEHIEEGGTTFKLKKAWILCIRYITPVLIAVVTIAGFVSIYNTVIK